MPIRKPGCLARAYAGWSALWEDGIKASEDGRLLNTSTRNVARKHDPAAVAQEYLKCFPQDHELCCPKRESQVLVTLGLALMERAEELPFNDMPKLCAHFSAHAQCALYGLDWQARHTYDDCQACASKSSELNFFLATKKSGRPKKSARGGFLLVELIGTACT